MCKVPCMVEQLYTYEELDLTEQPITTQSLSVHTHAQSQVFFQKINSKRKELTRYFSSVRPQLQQTQANSQTSQSLSLLTELHPFVQVIDAFSAIPIVKFFKLNSYSQDPLIIIPFSKVSKPLKSCLLDRNLLYNINISNSKNDHWRHFMQQSRNSFWSNR